MEEGPICRVGTKGDIKSKHRRTWLWLTFLSFSPFPGFEVSPGLDSKKESCH